MNKPLSLLRTEAEESCKLRGHEIEWRRPLMSKLSNSTIQNGVCKHCGEWVQLTDNPQPNGIDIGGPAVALNCTK